VFRGAFVAAIGELRGRAKDRIGAREVAAACEFANGAASIKVASVTVEESLVGIQKAFDEWKQRKTAAYRRSPTIV